MLVRLPFPRGGHGLRSLLLAAACLFLAGCPPPAADSKPNQNVSISWGVAPDPPSAGPVMVRFSLTEPGGHFVEGARVRVEGNMSHAGMKPVFGTADEVAPGRYEAPLELSMGGDWILLFEATLRDGSTLKWQEALPGVRGQ